VFKDCFVRCACFGEGLRLTYTEDGEFSVSMWKDRGYHKTEWRQRMRHIWRILTKGEPWDDEIVLHMDEARKLAAFIIEPDAREDR